MGHSKGTCCVADQRVIGMVPVWSLTGVSSGGCLSLTGPGGEAGWGQRSRL